MTRNIVIDGARLRIEEHIMAKDEPTIIFLHDSLGSIELWRDFPDELGKTTGFNTLVYDRQGYGHSSPFTTERKSDYLEIEADVLNKLLEQCNIEKAILFGHSDGGSISLIAAAKYPQRIMGIITEGAHIFVEDITLNGIADAMTAWQTTDLKVRLQKYHGDKTEAVFNAWAKTWYTDDYKDWNIEGFLPQITCPVLLIQGEYDEFGSIKQVDGIVNGVSGPVDKLIVPGVGHNPHKDAEEKVLEVATSFILRCKN